RDLGRQDFVVLYLGYADAGALANELKSWVEKNEKYRAFKYRYESTHKQAFENCCRHYHDFGGTKKRLHHEDHIPRPETAGWDCPRCDIYDPPP
ncbi:MAG: hypothetical protein NC924_05735, partial [Candidatus Omnitrophica bacterium]|nr:hypothetical protein [Candidatus Omnitrophota bacterium]